MSNGTDEGNTEVDYHLDSDPPQPTRDPHEVPVYYRPESQLEIQLAHSAMTRQFTVVRPITPFTTSQVLLVRETNNPGGGEIVLKIYDPRFMVNVRRVIKRTWDPEVEARSVELRQMNPIPDAFAGLPNFCALKKPEELENYVFLRARSDFASELKAYRQLQPLQGKGLPRLFGHGTLTSASMLPDGQPRYINPSALILEFVPNSTPLRDADPAMLRPDLIRSLLETVDSFHTFNVIHADPNPGNILFSPDRAVIIDFGEAYFRSEEESDEDWANAVFDEGDLRWCKIWITKRLGVESLDDYLSTVV
ncbi:hypothetical protein QCA50_016691 [Cerrena zonata]|uniref:Protein kinase domain-containing protein n=1 Tax=Cerrena zonata TaxID=2478898 RepID=A0AAW0FIX7_9APHY